MKAADYQSLVRVLSTIPVFQSARGRRQLLEMAGLGSVAMQIDLEGAPLIVAADILSVLDVYGADDTGVLVLDRLCNTLLPLLGENADGAVAIKTFLTHRGSIRPALVRTLETSHGSDQKDVELVEERIIGENTLRDLGFFESALSCARSVVYIEAPEWTGTGFLISEDLLVTNWHVLPNQEIASRSRFVFNFQRTPLGALNKTEEYPTSSKTYIADETKDLALVSLEGQPGRTWGKLRLAKTTAQKGERINIIQHPAGLPKHITVENNFVLFSNACCLQYVTSTLGGSSGAPILNDQWAVVGVHQAGGYLKTTGQWRAKLRNQGVAVDQIWTLPLGDLTKSISGVGM
jgi:V8-like Glu-specific endopeptidase